MLERTIAFLGAGNMAEAIIKGLLRAGIARPEGIIATGRRPERLEDLKRLYGVRTSQDNLAAAQEAEIVVLSVKPQAMDKLLVQVAPALDHRKLVISVAAGVPIAALERRLGAGARIIRTMPNTPSLVGAGACALAPGEHASEEDLAVASRIFQAVGTTTVVDENLLDAVTGLSGSGPAYVFLVIEALSDAGVKVGLPRYTALKLAAQTVLGSAQLSDRDQCAPRPAQGPGDEPRRHGDRGPAHAGGRWAAHHLDQRRGGRHPPGP